MAPMSIAEESRTLRLPDGRVVSFPALLLAVLSFVLVHLIACGTVRIGR